MKKSKKLSYEQQAVFIRQMVFVVRAGIPLVNAYEFIHTEAVEANGPARYDKGGDITEMVFSQVKKGMSFSEALRACGCFSPYLVAMVALGEQTGNLENSLSDLADYFEKLSAIRRKIRESFTYPLILLIMMTAVILFLIIEVLPEFAAIISGAGGELPAVASGILHFGQFVRAQYLPILLVLAALIVLLTLYFKSTAGKTALDRFLIRPKAFGGAAAKLATARFCEAMKMSLACGNDFPASLELSAGIMGNSAVSRRLLKMKEAVDSGTPVPQAMHLAGIFPSSFVRLFATAYKTGSLEETLERMSEYYQESFDDAVYAYTSKIEPALVIILSVIAAVILFSVMLPIINIMQLIG